MSNSCPAVAVEIDLRVLDASSERLRSLKIACASAAFVILLILAMLNSL
jgi:hypothetical protein